MSALKNFRNEIKPVLASVGLSMNNKNAVSVEVSKPEVGFFSIAIGVCPNRTAEERENLWREAGETLRKVLSDNGYSADFPRASNNDFRSYAWARIFI